MLVHNLVSGEEPGYEATFLTVVYVNSLTCLYSVPPPHPTPDYVGDILKKAGDGYLFNYIKQTVILNAHISVHVCTKL